MAELPRAERFALLFPEIEGSYAPGPRVSAAVPIAPTSMSNWGTDVHRPQRNTNSPGASDDLPSSRSGRTGLLGAQCDRLRLRVGGTCSPKGRPPFRPR